MNEERSDAVQSVGGEPYSIPKPSAVPEAKRPKHRPEEINYADNDEIAEKTASWVRRYYDKFTSQGARDEFEVNCDTADELFRASADRTSLGTSEDDNLKVTGSHIKSSSFYTDLRTITSFEQGVILGDRSQLPVVYQPMPRSDEYQQKEGQRISNEQNAVLYWAFNEGNMWDSIANWEFFVNKYGNQFFEMDWCYKTEKRLVREPVGKYEEWEDRGDGFRVPTKFRTVEKEIVVKDSPTLIIHDNKDAWSDAMIYEIQDQSCVIFRKQKQLGDLYNGQATGQLLNVENIGSGQAYDGENSQEGDQLADRQTNANESNDSSEPNTMIDVWCGYIRIPVEDGKWDEENNLPTWHKFSFAGSIDGSMVCMLIQPNRFGESIPVECGHSHKDDKGLYHDGYVQRVKPILAQEMTTMDQATDNWTQRNCAPLLADEGSLLTRRKEYTDGRRPILFTKAGARRPESLKTDDTTQLAIPMLQMLKERRFEVMGINKTFRGEELGSRTSAGEALTVFEMARKPAYEDVIYKGGQILSFTAKWVMEFTRAYMNPDMRVQVSYEGHDYDVAPGALYGRLKTRIMFVQQFENSLIARKDMNDFYTTRLPIYLQSGVIDKTGLSVLARQDLMNHSIKNVDEILTTPSTYDAERNALMENDAIVRHGINDMPMQGEDHATHLKAHKPYLANIQLAPDAEGIPKENIQLFKLHIQETERLQEEEAQGMEQASAQLGAGAQAGEQAEARTPGEEAGDAMGAQAGQDFNPTTAGVEQLT